PLPGPHARARTLGRFSRTRRHPPRRRVVPIVRWHLLGPMVRKFARLSHDQDPAEIAQGVSREPADIADDGRILATGKYERRLRLLALAATVVSCGWLLAFARGMLRLLRDHSSANFPTFYFLLVGVFLVVRFAGRARGKLVWMRKGRR